MLTKYISKQHHVVLVLGDDVCPVERSVVSFAKRRGVPTILVQDGILNDQQSWEQWLRAGRPRGWAMQVSRKLLQYRDFLPPLTMYGASGCTKVAVWGEGTRDLMMGYGVCSEKIVVTGAPRFDQLFQMARAQDSMWSKSISKQRLLFAALLLSNWKIDSFDKDCSVINSLESLARIEPDWEIVVRPHPSERLEDYRRIFNLLGVKKLKLDQRSSIVSNLRDCTVVLTYASTVGVEGMILGKPVICLPIDPVHAPLYAREGAAITVKHLADLGGLIKAVLTDAKLQYELAQRRQAFISRHLGHTDGASASRVARLIESLF
jgi:CDP-glycerol glycerophosphotransferase (TagB/SpsB family)